MRASKILARALLAVFTMFALLATSACSKSSSSNDAITGGGRDGGPGSDTGMPSNSDGGPGSGDAMAVDTGPGPCLHDQGGPENRGCDPGQVCNLAMNPPQCVAGHKCMTDLDCNVCSSRTMMPNETCGHGFKITSFCDDRQGNVCARSRAPCETCTEDKDCGRPDPVLPVNATSLCVDYGSGKKFCGRSCSLGSCPKGFTCDAATMQCKRGGGLGQGLTCEDTVICPANDMPQSCVGHDQICPDAACPNNAGYCGTDDLPGAVGICIKYCKTNADCGSTPGAAICNPTNGLCVAGCTAGSCAAGKVCDYDGQCHDMCNSNMDCDTRYPNMHTYCNLMGGVAPDLYKPYRDAHSCAPLGCEKAVDCPVAGETCDTSMNPPACIVGCKSDHDCLSGWQCKSTGGQQPMMSYTHAQCQALAQRATMTEVGVCCDPGCPTNTCGTNQFCCGDPKGAYPDPSTCLTLTPTVATKAQAGDCFVLPPHPFCGPICDPSMMNCNSGWMPGFDTDPNINGGQPFQEQEFCVPATPPNMMGQQELVCSVTCDEAAAAMGKSGGCPQGWPCRPFLYTCSTDTDCVGTGLTCALISKGRCVNTQTGQVTTTQCAQDSDCMNAMLSCLGAVKQCKCGSGGNATGTCGNMNRLIYTQPVMITHPRCVAEGTAGDMFCAAGYNCAVPQLPMTSYPSGCFQ